MPRIAQFGEKFKIFFFFTLSRPTLRIFSEIFVPRKREEQSSASRFQFPSYYLEKGQTLRRGAWASWPIPASKIRKFRTSRKGRHLEKFGDFVPRKRDEIFVPRKKDEIFVPRKREEARFQKKSTDRSPSGAGWSKFL